MIDVKQSGLALSATLENKAYKARAPLGKTGFVPDRDAAPLVVIIPLTTSYDQLPGSNVNLRIFKHEAKKQLFVYVCIYVCVCVCVCVYVYVCVFVCADLLLDLFKS